MIQLHRARLGLVAAICVTLVLLVTQLPLGELLHQHGAISTIDGQLETVSARNKALGSEITALAKPSTVETIAHEEYGLVAPGQRSFVVLPAGHRSTGGANALDEPALSRADLASADPSTLTGIGGGGASVRAGDGSSTSGSIWSRVVNRLAFWRWAF